MWVELLALEHIKSLGYGVTFCHDSVVYNTFNFATVRFYRDNYVLFDLETGEIVACIPVLRFVGVRDEKRYLQQYVWRFREIARFLGGVNAFNSDAAVNLRCLDGW